MKVVWHDNATQTRMRPTAPEVVRKLNGTMTPLTNHRKRNWMIRPELVGGTFLVMSLIVFPIVEHATRSYDSHEWQILTLVLPALGVVLLVLPAWLRARPVRQLFEQLQGVRDNAFISIVASRENSTEPPDLRVLTLGAEGMGLHSVADTQVYDWPSLRSVSVEPDIKSRHSSFSIVRADGESVVTLIPMHKNGRSKLSPWEADEWAAELGRRLRLGR